MCEVAYLIDPFLAARPLIGLAAAGAFDLLRQLKGPLAKSLLAWKNRGVDKRNISTVIILGAWLTFAPAHAHHSWSGIYDTRKSITVEGVVTEFLLRRPHLALLIDVRNDAGETEQWTVEWGSLRRLQEAGYDGNVFQPGDRVVVTGQPAWTPGRKSVRMRSLSRPADGFTLSERQRR